MKFSACMLVSREGRLMEDAYKSIEKQDPNEIRVYLDPVMLGDHLEQVEAWLLDRGAKVFFQEVTPEIEDHHIDVVHAVHRALLEAENRWVAWNDDDDMMLSDRISILEEHAAPDVGVIYGDVLAVRGNIVDIRRTKQITGSEDVAQIIGSGQLYNRDAFREIHHMVDHGYFWDFKIFYWMMRAGYRAIYVPKIVSLQNVNTQPGTNRQKLRGKWSLILGRLKKTELSLEAGALQEKLDAVLASGGYPIDECVVCHSKEYTPAFEKSGATFVTCDGCGLIYVKDRDQFGYAPDKKLERTVFAKEALAPGQTEIAGKLLLGEIRPYVSSGRVLDHGCATGYHSAGLADKGYEVYGVEPNRTSAEWGAEHFPIKMHIGYLDTAPWPKEYFDVIVTKETIEHFHKPSYELNLMRTMLKPGGLLLLKTGASQNNKDFGPDWKYCEPCEFYFFTLNLLTRLIRENGFNIVKTQDLIDRRGEMRVWAIRAI
jgi:SAM-dependent methyltransferase